MGDVRGFLKVARQTSCRRPVEKRVEDYKDVSKPFSEGIAKEQALRCMDCGTPFCHWSCPVGSYIPEWNDYASSGKLEQALILLGATNNFPEITGRICPAPCEYSCVLGVNDDPVNIRENELAIIEYGFKKGLIKPVLPKKLTGKKTAVVGSGPAGLSCAAELRRAGHEVIVFERDKNAGGILRYGIPDFKLEKNILDRRLNLWKKEGIVFKTGIDIGKDYPADKLLKEFDAVCLAGGSRVPRDLKIEGRSLKGIYFAMDYLCQANRRLAGEKMISKDIIKAKNKKVVVIGGGDTGADCVGTALRQKCDSLTQIEIMSRPPECRGNDYPWPLYPVILKTSSSHEEGGIREWSVLTKSFKGENNRVRKLSCVQVEFAKLAKRTCPTMKEIKGSEFEIEADMVILAMGFLHPEHSGIVSELGLELDDRGNVKTRENYMTSREKVFAAGDMRRGQSLVVWALSEGRRSAYYIDKYLMGESYLDLI